MPTQSDVTTATPTIDGESEISGFGNTTWVTIIDETPGDPTYTPGEITAALTRRRTITASRSYPMRATRLTRSATLPCSINSGVFIANGVKTIVRQDYR